MSAANTANNPALRPLGVGELLDQSIRLYRHHFLTYIGIVAVVQIPFSLLLLWSQLLARSAGTTLRPSTASTYVNLLVILFITPLVEAVIMAPTARALFDQHQGQTIGVMEAYRRIGSAWLSLLTALASATVVMLLLLGWFALPVFGWASGLGILLFYLGVIVPFLGPIVVLEGRSGFAALRRGWDLARRRFWAVVSVVAILWLFALVVAFGPELLISLIAQRVFFGPPQPNLPAAQLPTSLFIFQAVLAQLVGLLFRPVQTIGKTLLYFDLRVRTEGLDLVWLMQPAETPASATGAHPAERSPLVMLKELGNFVWLSLASCGLFIALGVVFVAFALVILRPGVGRP